MKREQKRTERSKKILPFYPPGKRTFVLFEHKTLSLESFLARYLRKPLPTGSFFKKWVSTFFVQD